MRGDFTRDTFDRFRNVSRVLMQQGRVQLDADFNEQVAILLRYMRLLATDLGGPHWGPREAIGFEILTKDSPDLELKLPVIESDEARRGFIMAALEEGNAVICPGRYYVEGVLAENHKAILYTEQPGYDEFDPQIKLDALQNLQSPLLVYLDVWERHITHIEDHLLREVALGGPDTCSRAQVVWQVKVLFPSGIGEPLACDAVRTLPRLGTGRLRARARLDQTPPQPCAIASDARYRGPENQLYRVEVHKGGRGTGEEGGATFKWSRDNGSVTFPVCSLTGANVLLEHLGRDTRLSLSPGDWVEIVDDSIAMSGHAGPLAQVDMVNRDELAVTLRLPDGQPNLPGYTEEDAAAKHPLLRRWDHPGDPALFGGALAVSGREDTEDGWIPLEDGVQVWFEGGDAEYRPGDYWLIPARVATEDVEWPKELDENGNPETDADGHPIGQAREAHGPQHYYAPLFLYQDGSADDCRCLLEPLPCRTGA